MATRFYLPSSGSTPFSPSYSDGSWTADSSAHIYVPAPRTKSNTSLTTLAGILASGTTTYTRYVTAISDPLDSAQTISGNVTGAIGKCLEASNQEDASFGIRVRVVNSSGTHLAQLHSTISGTEFSSSTASSRTRSSVAITSYAAAAGDRIVVEFGVTGLTPACAGNVQFNVGDPSGVSDFNLTAGDTNNYCGWLELSCNLTFSTSGTGTPSGVSGTCTVGTPTTSGEAKTTPDGIVMTGSVGIPVADAGSSTPATATPSGVLTTGELGDAVGQGAALIILSGIASTSYSGLPTVTGNSIQFPMGIAGVGWIGDVIVSAGASRSVSGLDATGVVGEAISTGEASAGPDGVECLAEIGIPAIVASVNSLVLGIEAISAVGLPIGGVGYEPTSHDVFLAIYREAVGINWRYTF